MDIKKLAIESGANETGGVFSEYTFSTRELNLFAQKIIEAEREDCARLCESLHGERNGDCAAAIRSLK